MVQPPVLSFLPSADFAGPVQRVSHRTRHLSPGGPLLPHILLLLSPWRPERGLGGGGGGRRRKHGSRLQRKEGAEHLLRHLGGGGSCHTVLVRRKRRITTLFITYRTTTYNEDVSDPSIPNILNTSAYLEQIRFHLWVVVTEIPSSSMFPMQKHFFFCLFFLEMEEQQSYESHFVTLPTVMRCLFSRTFACVTGEDERLTADRHVTLLCTGC